MVTDQQVTLVQESFAKVEPISEQAAEIFYGKLFEIDPSLRSMFKHDMKAQGKKLMATLAVVVKGLSKPDSIMPAVKELAVRHVEYGVEPEHYTYVGNALLRTLAEGLGDDFTPETRQAWVEAYRLLAKVMKEEAYGTSAAA
jgi:hemoglobin-like flavoprotein